MLRRRFHPSEISGAVTSKLNRSPGTRPFFHVPNPDFTIKSCVAIRRHTSSGRVSRAFYLVQTLQNPGIFRKFNQVKILANPGFESPIKIGQSTTVWIVGPKLKLFIIIAYYIKINKIFLKNLKGKKTINTYLIIIKSKSSIQIILVLYKNLIKYFIYL
ncbi:hypothetical protein OXYTRIMIC_369 [Oxytricha trifallax]|uniref:Uncharacterized protein n=1 Tax=Oxytricha trifallax TaxID=1172189 RepID=A0A073IAE6_9SPIT|nr:hypothetical protein OXYTRIMIC_369 [Oxytricha trifallax]